LDDPASCLRHRVKDIPVRYGSLSGRLAAAAGRFREAVLLV
jgi:hypothetical protein